MGGIRNLPECRLEVPLPDSIRSRCGTARATRLGVSDRIRGVVHLPLDGQLSGSKDELNRVHPNLRAREAAMPRRKFGPQLLTAVPLAPPPSVRLGALTQRLLSGAHRRGLD